MKESSTSRKMLIAIILVEAAIGVVSSVLVDLLPIWVRPYLWLAWPLLILLVATLIVMKLLQIGISLESLRQMRMIWLLLLLLVVAGILTLTWWEQEDRSREEILVERAGLSWSPDSKQLAFVSMRDGNEEIYAVNLDGSELTNITNHPARDRFPSWSPDGQRIAFQSDREGHDAIYAVEIEINDRAIRLTSGRDPAWSPDGGRIAFEDSITGNFELYMIGDDGSGRTNLSNSESSFDGSPAWCSDGIQLAFESNRELGLGIYTVECNGLDLRPLVTSPMFEWAGEPSWSPKCDRISFQGGTDSSHAKLQVVDILEGQAIAIHALAPSFTGRDAEWSPDGRYIAFFSRSEGKWQIYVYDLQKERVLPIPHYLGPKWWLGALMALVVLCTTITMVLRLPGNTQRQSSAG
jgi:Tol biopolymer transport system component